LGLKFLEIKIESKIPVIKNKVKRVILSNKLSFCSMGRVACIVPTKNAIIKPIPTLNIFEILPASQIRTIEYIKLRPKIVKTITVFIIRRSAPEFFRTKYSNTLVRNITAPAGIEDKNISLKKLVDLLT
jgi:hypothetical protein